jgi:hypothetical protein
MRCEHKRQKSTCKECGGSSLCIHKRQKNTCKECGGSAICEHKIQRATCKECGGSAICEHKIRRATCKICDIEGYIANRMRIRLRIALKNNSKERSTIEYLGCSIEAFREYFESLFKDGMSWNNIEEWHIDHIKPCCSFELSKEEEKIKCFHYTNLQPLWAYENLSKGDKFDDKNFNRIWDKNKWINKN